MHWGLYETEFSKLLETPVMMIEVVDYLPAGTGGIDR